ncbi:OmpA family protein [Hydrogenophaga laconesensis]|uniref:Outer membrane protein OmpA-like peptidoglycan-associated protein n=1 Tax=Hydrogenophaga laconesensis TaxID=1805971 RepID=A0ABU1V8G0_9BURK|nr:OmpA family protein [Hydrogenophaga laconesensis]MDR7093754.1 outer membrane protein OmpA-like peptidoglycan-associated protein [Hydrogenophaga laconesensis]
MTNFNIQLTRGLTVTALVAAVALTGCANMSETQQGTAKGAGIGAVAGALLGAATGGSKGAATGAVLGAGAGAVGGYVWSNKMQEQKKQMEAATAGTGIGVSQTSDNRLKLDVPADAGFATGRSTVSPTLQNVLSQFAGTLNANPVTAVAIVGHTDSTGSDAVNNPLSFDRANATRDYLVARGVSATRIATDGRGSHQPIADNSTAQGRAANRRVEIYVAEPAQTAAR